MVIRSRERRETVNEESPNFLETGCRRNPGEGDLKESATEIYRLFFRQGWKGAVRAHRALGNKGSHVNPVRCKIDKNIQWVARPNIFNKTSLEAYGDASRR